MGFPRWITTPAGKSLIIHSDEECAREMAVDEDNRPIKVVAVPSESTAPEPEPDPPVVEPRINHLVNTSTPVDNRMLKRGPGRPPGSRNRK